MADRVESIQLAAFVHATPPFSAHEAWLKAFPGEILDGFRTLSPGNTVAEGKVKNTFILLQVQANRVDIVAKAPVTPTPVPDAIPDFDAARSLCEGAFAALMPFLFLARAAMVINAHTLARDAIDAVAKIGTMIPSLSLPNGTIDCLHQLTVQYESSIKAGRKINQLLRWQSVQSAIVAAAQGPVSVEALLASAGANVQFAAVHMIDVFGAEPEVFASEEDKAAHVTEVVERAVGILNGGVSVS